MFFDKRDQKPLESNRSPITVLGEIHFSKASFTDLLKIPELCKLYLLHIVLRAVIIKTTLYALCKTL